MLFLPLWLTASGHLANGTNASVSGSCATPTPGAARSPWKHLRSVWKLRRSQRETSRVAGCLGWIASSLAPLPANELTNRQHSSAGNCQHRGAGPCFLTSIWMSGFGPAADKQGDVYFVTGNSDAGSYSPPDDVQESAVKISGGLETLMDYFTPYQQADWDKQDWISGPAGSLFCRSSRVRFLSGGGRGQIRYDVPAEPRKHGKACDVSAGQGRREGQCRSLAGVASLILRPRRRGTHCQQRRAQGGNLEGDDVSHGGSDAGSRVGFPGLGTGIPGFSHRFHPTAPPPNSAVVWAVSRPESDNGGVTLYAIDPATARHCFPGRWEAGPCEHQRQYCAGCRKRPRLCRG